MIWQQVILWQIIASSVMTIWYRVSSVRYTKKTFSISLAVYFVVALAGFALSFVHNQFLVPDFPNSKGVLYVLIEGACIPLAWLFSYKLLSVIGASSMVVAQTVNFLLVALFGIIFLGDKFNVFIMLGGILLIGGVGLALTTNGQNRHKNSASLSYKVLLLSLGSLFLAIGLTFEKLAINEIGVWNYAMYGWGAQLVGAVVLFALFGRKELQVHAAKGFYRSALFAGFLTAVSGGLFIYSLSKGVLSSVILASSAKVALTSILAFWVLKERNNLRRRVAAMAVSIVGLVVIFSA